MPIIVGVARSGTTLFRLMLDAHPALAIPPETGFLLASFEAGLAGEDPRAAFFRAVTGYPPDAPAWGDHHIPAESFRRRLREIEPFSVAEGFRLFYRMYAERFGKPRYGDKTPMYAPHLAYLEGLLPEARFLHLIRDGRDVVASLGRQWFSPGPDIESQAAYWRYQVAAARRQGALCRHYLEVRYEDLVRRPAAELRRVCAFLDLEFHPDMLRYHERAPWRLREHETRFGPDGVALVTHEQRLVQQRLTLSPPDPTRIGLWRQQLTPGECRRFHEVADSLLGELGYRD
jgi:hypothetical protein